MNINPPKFVGAPLTNDRILLDALRGSELVRKAVAERDRDVLAFRKTAAAKLAKLESDAEANFPKLRAAKDAAVAAALKAEKAWREACDIAQRAQQELTSASFKYSDEYSRLEAQLTETANAEIVLFLADMRDEWEKCSKQFAFATGFETVNQITGRRAEVTINNKESVQARKAAIREAEAAAIAMRLDPDQSAVPARLQELRAGLPAITGIAIMGGGLTK